MAERTLSSKLGKILLTVVVAVFMSFAVGVCLYVISLILFCGLDLWGNTPPEWLIFCYDLTGPGVVLAKGIPIVSIVLGVYAAYGFMWKK